MPNTKHADQVECGLMAIERDVSARAVADDELPQVAPRTPADPRVIAEDFDGASYLAERRERGTRRRIEQEFHDALKIFNRSFGIDYPRHRTAFGRRTARPRAFASR